MADIYADGIVYKNRTSTPQVSEVPAGRVLFYSLNGELYQMDEFGTETNISSSVAEVSGSIAVDEITVSSTADTSGSDDTSASFHTAGGASIEKDAQIGGAVHVPNVYASTRIDIGDATSNATLAINKGDASNGNFYFQNEGDNRVQLRLTSSESFEMRHFDVTGTLIDTPLTCNPIANSEFVIRRPTRVSGNTLRTDNTTDTTSPTDTAASLSTAGGLSVAKSIESGGEVKSDTNMIAQGYIWAKGTLQAGDDTSDAIVRLRSTTEWRVHAESNDGQFRIIDNDNGKTPFKINPGLTGTIVINAQTHNQDTTDTTSPTDTNASLSTAGGLSVAKTIHAATLDVAGNTTLANNSGLYIKDSGGTGRSVVRTTSGDATIFGDTTTTTYLRSLGNVHIQNGAVQVYDTTDTTSPTDTAASLSTAGGLSVAKNVQVGGHIYLPNGKQFFMYDSVAAQQGVLVLNSSNVLRLAYGTGISGLQVEAPLNSLDTTDTTSPTDTAASLSTAGGLSVAGTVYCGTSYFAQSGTNTAALRAGTTNPQIELTDSNGTWTARNAVATSNQYQLRWAGTTRLTLSTTGDLNADGSIYSQDTTDANTGSHTSVASIASAGGLSVAKRVYVGTNLNVGGSATFNSNIISNSSNFIMNIGTFNFIPRNGNASTNLDFDFDQVTSAGATIRLFRNTNTTGVASLQIYAANDTATINTRFYADGSAYFNGPVEFRNTTDSSSPTDAAASISTDGGASIAKNASVGGFINVGETSVSISSNAITATGTHMKISNGGTLSTINGGSTGDTLILTFSGSSVSVSEGGNISLNSTSSFDTHAESTIMFIYSGSLWKEISRAYNAPAG